MKEKILHLHLKKKWYELLEKGEKNEEYREIKRHWVTRICKYYNCAFPSSCYIKCPITLSCLDSVPTEITHVCFSYGYTKKRMTFKVNNIYIGYGRTEWGAPAGERVFVIELVK